MTPPSPIPPSKGVLSPAAPETAPRSVNSTLVTWGLLTLAVVLPTLILLSPFAVSVAIGGILSVLCTPIYARARRRLPAWAAGLLVTLGVIVLVLVPLSLLVVGGVRQGAAILGQLSNDDAPTVTEIIERVRRWFPFTDALGTPEEIRAALKDGLTSLSQSASQLLFDAVRAIPRMVIQLVIVVLTTYFFLVDGRSLYQWVAEKVPLSSQIRVMLVTSFRVATNAVVLASVAAAAAQSLLVAISFWILGVPSALFAAGAAFVLAWIPPTGAAPVWIIAAIYLYIQGSPTRAAIMVAFGVVIGITDNVVRPLVLRGRQAMNPMVSLLAILGGLAVLGLPGVFIGPLLVSMAIAVLDIWPAVASYCGIPVSGAGEEVPDVPMLDARVPTDHDLPFE